tara:strand:- start:519 stop:890 length:372 start_codon:yes stop_codon:yes gene_type:complete
MKIIKFLPLIPAVLLAIISLNWIFMPETAAESLGLIFNDPLEKNTIIRDFTAFFLSTCIFCFLGFFTKSPEWLYASGIIFFIALVFNVVATIFHNASFSADAFMVEVILAIICFLSGRYVNKF